MSLRKSIWMLLIVISFTFFAISAGQEAKNGGAEVVGNTEMAAAAPAGGVPCGLEFCRFPRVCIDNQCIIPNKKGLPGDSCYVDGDCISRTDKCTKVKCISGVCTPIEKQCPAFERCNPLNGKCECYPGLNKCPNGACLQCCDNEDCTRVYGEGSGMVCCQGKCVDTQKDPNNCGACGQTCTADASKHVTGVACSGGACVITSCIAGWDDCDNDYSNGCEIQINDADINNCGACDVACTADASKHVTGVACSGGACVVTSCSVGWDDCDNAYSNGCEIQIDDADVNNCGACGNYCPGGRTCDSGVCSRCPAGQTDCGGVCVDTQTDTNNCGACDNYCAGGRTCDNGACSRCPVGQTDCNGVCVDTQTNTSHCGACDFACDPGESCIAGVCTESCGDVSCDPGETCCCINAFDPMSVGEEFFEFIGYCREDLDYICVDTQTDAEHCGDCTRFCINGKCCNGQCVDSRTDSDNCGVPFEPGRSN